VAEHDPEAFEDLFDSEPGKPSTREVAEWVDRYGRLVGLLERQLEETRRFADAVPDAMREYLDRENIKILAEELAIFRRRLAYWHALQ
jgi:hypothetical protein